MRFITKFLTIATMGIISQAARAAKPKKLNKGSPEVVCYEYTVFNVTETEEIMSESIAALNPHLDFLQEGGSIPPVGTPVCVMGKVVEDEKEVVLGGKHHDDLVQYQTIGVHDNCHSIILHSDPPIDLISLVSLNPHLDCHTLHTTKTSHTVYLPPGTRIDNSAPPNESIMPIFSPTQDCLVGPWGDWEECHGGTQTRYRNIYRMAGPNGIACPETHETQSCDAQDDDDHRDLQSCDCGNVGGYDGCSVPDGLPFYALMTPACNVHDICYSCESTWAFLKGQSWFDRKAYCDNKFLSKMKSMCNSYWSGWWQGFDRGYCIDMANAYFVGVLVVGNPSNYENPISRHCWYHPDNACLNNVYSNAGWDPKRAGCSCDGRSCDFW